MSEEAYASVLHFAHSRTAYGENEFATISRLLEGVSAEELRQNNASFHARCRKRLVNSAMLKRAEARFEKAASSQNTSILSRLPGRPSFASQTGSSTPVVFHGLTEQTSKRILRSSTATFNKKLCFFCQSHDDKQDIHLIHTENWRKSVLLAQQVMYQTKTDRKVRYVPQSETREDISSPARGPIASWGWPPCSPANEK